MINKFDDFMKSLFESYDSPVDINWNNVNPYKLVGTFEVSGNKYRIDCIMYDDNIWTYKFSVFDNTINDYTMELVKTDIREKMIVLGTVRTGIEYLIEVKSPSAIIYAALDDSDGRKKLYTRFANEIVSKFGYEYRTSNQSGKQVFILYKGIGIELVFGVIGKIINII